MSKIKIKVQGILDQLNEIIDNTKIQNRYNEAMKAKEDNQLVDLEDLDDYIANNR